MLLLDVQMRSIRKSFGARVRELRIAQDLDVKTAASALAIDPSTLYSIERGQNTPSFGLMIAMAKLYKVDEAAMFIWPGTHPLHDAWELLRRAPPDKVGDLLRVLEAEVAKSRVKLLPPAGTARERRSRR